MQAARPRPVDAALFGTCFLVNILIADDNAQNRYLLEQTLRSAGHTSESVSNGREGLQRAQAGRFDAIVSDILMPQMDGFQFCREVKADPALNKIPFIFYTATYLEPADVAFGRGLGAANYLLKPMEPGDFLAALQAVSSGPPVVPPPPSEEDYLQQYNARLVRKLESKMTQLERANAELLKTNLALNDEINRRRAAENAARAALALQRATLESTADGVVAVDAEGRIVAWNRRCAEIWGLPPEAEPPRTFAALLTRLCEKMPDPVAGAAEWRARAEAAPTDEAQVIVWRDGRACERLARELTAPDGRSGRVWTFRDITERRRMEESRRALQAQLIQLQKMEALGVLAGGIAHDFNNLLTAILGQTTIAMEEVPEVPELQRSLEQIRKAARHGAELVRQILTFSRHDEPERRVLQLAEVVGDAMKFLRSTVPAGVAFEVDLAPDVPPIRADATQLHQVLMNLVTNADHAMNGKGCVTITLRAERIEAANERGLRPGWYARLAVRDTGPGIAENVRRRIFEPFFTTKPPGKGTGLGLAVVHGIVSSCGGQIAVQSEPGHGAEFELIFPAANGAAEPSEPVPSTVHGGAGELVLLVEDDDAVREALGVLLQRTGYRVEAHASPIEALAGFGARVGEFALLLTDLSMPELSGSELARAVRQRRPDLPVVIMTGYLSTEKLDMERASLQFELLLKPCTAESLSAAVFRALNVNR